jgi:hypothetical protein
MWDQTTVPYSQYKIKQLAPSPFVVVFPQTIFRDNTFLMQEIFVTVAASPSCRVCPALPCPALP